MKRVSGTAPPRLLNSEMIVLPHGGKALVAVLTMDTDDGVIELAINRAVSEQLAALLREFLKG